MADGEFHATASSLARVVGGAKLVRWRLKLAEEWTKIYVHSERRLSYIEMPVAHVANLDCRAHHEQRISGGKGPRDTISREKGSVQQRKPPPLGEKMFDEWKFMAKKKRPESRALELVQGVQKLFAGSYWGQEVATARILSTGKIPRQAETNRQQLPHHLSPSWYFSGR